MNARTGVLLLLGFGLAWLLIAAVFTGGHGVKLHPITSDFHVLSAALKGYKNHTKHYPTIEQGLAALVARPDTGPLPTQWKQVMTKVPLDPWGHEYRYRLLPEGKDFELRSAGEDGLLGTKDDLSSLDE